MFRNVMKKQLIKESAIHYQLDNKNFKAIEDIVIEISKDLEKYTDYKVYRYTTSKEFIKHIENIEKILTEQFNIECIVGNNEECNFFSTYGYGRVTDNISQRYKASETIKEYESGELKRIKDEVEKINEKEPLTKEAERAWQNYYFSAIEGNYELVNVLLEEGLQLDLKNVKFIKRPKKLKFYINMDFVAGCLQRKCVMIPNIKAPLEPKEFVAIMLHELGHCWEQVYALFKLGNDIDVLQDIVREEVSKGNKDLPSVVEIFYRRQGIERKPSKNVTQCMIELSSELSDRASEALTSQRGIKINLEQQADEFASRFGYGPYIATGLAKIAGSYDMEESIICAQTLLSMFGLTSLSIYSGMLVPLAGIGIFIIGIPFIFYCLYRFSTNLFVNGYDRNNYDNLYRRFVRVKNTTVRRLKFIEDPEIKKNILDTLDRLNKTIADYKKLEENRKLKLFMENLVLKYNPKKQDFRMGEILEDLIANDIYVGYEKIKDFQRSIK